MIAKRLYPILLVLILAAMLDTCVASFRTPKRFFAAVAGKEMAISGELEGQVVPSGMGGTVFEENKITNPAVLKTLLSVSPEHQGLAIRFVERNGRMWRAILTVQSEVAKGDYTFQVLQPNEIGLEEPTYTIRVFASAAARQASDPSYTVRLTGIEPWWFILAALPPLAILMARSWQTSRAEERRLRGMGIGTIYKLARRKDQWELVGGLGYADGLRQGDPVRLMKPNHTVLAEATVHSIKTDYFTTYVDLAVPVTPDCLVARQGVVTLS